MPNGTDCGPVRRDILGREGGKPLPPNLTGPEDGRVEGFYPGASRAPPGTSQAASCPHVPRMLYS